ncbi:UNVERIFIED_CONTAM: 50S ribosomal protein L4, chloroplastic [Sesamum calycinum]|uniref:Large ribosomal subunit protein uL4c n=1 Tax=Sesamum calycinum TaxID=2727403 RepID=A0AAW2IS31_9LAMI
MAAASPSSFSFFSSSVFLSNSNPSSTKFHFLNPPVPLQIASLHHYPFRANNSPRALVRRKPSGLRQSQLEPSGHCFNPHPRGGPCGGQKPYPQKKTGRARRGSQRTPLRPGGGVIFGPKPKDWSVKINKKEKRLAFSTALASAFECTVVVEDFGDKFEKPKTKEFIAMMNRLGLDPKKKSMFLMTEVSDNVRLSSRNIGTLKLLTPRTLNLFDILDSEKLILTKGAVEFLNERYGLDSEEDKEEDEFEEVEYADEG